MINKKNYSFLFLNLKKNSCVTYLKEKIKENIQEKF